MREITGREMIAQGEFADNCLGGLHINQLAALWHWQHELGYIGTSNETAVRRAIERTWWHCRIGRVTLRLSKIKLTPKEELRRRPPVRRPGFDPFS